MTDEELAEEYVHNHLHYEVAKREDGTDYAKGVSNVTIKQAFLDGLKAGRPKWHKVDSEVLPNNLRYVWTNVGPGYRDDDGWWGAFGRLQGVVAWCEPKFEGK